MLPAVALDFPALSGRVVDDAGILDAATRAALTEKLADAGSQDHRPAGGGDAQVAAGHLDRGFRGRARTALARSDRQDKNNGALLIVAPNERKVRIEVGYGLEGTLTDAVSRLIIENAIIPRFRAGDFAGGITRGVDDIISVLTGDAEEWKQRAAKRPEPRPGAGSILIVILVLAVFVLVFLMMAGATPRDPRYRGGRRGGSSGGPSWGPGPAASVGGGWSGGGSSGGGFSGGGGSFGGGGSSGSW